MTILVAMLLAGGSIVVPASTNVWFNPASSPPATWCGGLCVGNADTSSTCVASGSCRGYGHEYDFDAIDVWRFDSDSANQPSVSGTHDLQLLGSGGWRRDAGQVDYSIEHDAGVYWDAVSGTSRADGALTVEAWVWRDNIVGSYDMSVIDMTMMTDCGYNQNALGLTVRKDTHDALIAYRGGLCVGYWTMMVDIGANGFKLGQWNHVAAVWGPGCSLGDNWPGGPFDVPCWRGVYLNGGLLSGTVQQTTNPSSPLSGTWPIHIGMSWAGKTDDIRLSATARTAAEVLDSYRRGRMCH